jgi:hypothetical protein
MHLLPQDRESLIDTSFRFVSWLAKNFPSVKDSSLPSYYDSFGELTREAPTVFWGAVGGRDYAELATKSAFGESVLDRVVAIVKDSSPEVQNEILVGFVEAHMFPRPGSPLAKEMGEALGMDLSGLC